MAAVEGTWGREQDARRHAAEAFAAARQPGSWFPAIIIEWTLGLIDLAAGRPAEAAGRLLAITGPEYPGRNPVIALEAMPDAVEAGLRAGLDDQAAVRLETFRALVAAAPAQPRLALLARCDALTGARDPDEAFGEAITRAPGLPPLQRRRIDSRAHLRAALELFRTLGAAPWAGRAEAELRATGETARKRDPAAVEQLTPQELQIARLVTEGLANKEIAAQLYLSPRTVDYHLRKVFTKLGITSRTQLVRDGLPGPGSA